MEDPFIFKILATATVIGATIFIGTYLREPWRHSEFGRAFMVLVSAVWLFAVAAVLRQWLGLEYRFRQEIRIGAQAGLTFAVWYITVLLLRTRRRDRKRALTD